MVKSNRLPPYFCWRDGRPRWNPGKGLRARGFKGIDLKDDAGEWLTKGAAIDRCELLNEKARTAGTPDGTTPQTRTVAALVAAYRTSPTMRAPKDRDETGGAAIVAEKLRLAERTRQGYASYLRLIEAALGKYRAAELTPAHLKEFYFALVEERGLPTANACMRVVKILFYFAIDQLRWSEIGSNPARGVKLAPTEGRLVMFSFEEFFALVAAADYAGLSGMGDAITLAALTGFRKGDLLRLAEGDLRDGFYIVTPHKTARSSGLRAYVPVTTLLKDRLETMRARKRASGVVHTLELVDSLSGAPFHGGGKEFDNQWRAVRFLASGAAFALEDIFAAMAGEPAPERNPPFTPQPGVLEKHFADFRDTAVTWSFYSGCTDAEIANMQGRSLASVKAILNKHYLVRGEELSKAAGGKLERWQRTKTVGG